MSTNWFVVVVTSKKKSRERNKRAPAAVWSFVWEELQVPTCTGLWTQRGATTTLVSAADCRLSYVVWLVETEMELKHSRVSDWTVSWPSLPPLLKFISSDLKEAQLKEVGDILFALFFIHSKKKEKKLTVLQTMAPHPDKKTNKHLNKLLKVKHLSWYVISKTGVVLCNLHVIFVIL